MKISLEISTITGMELDLGVAQRLSKPYIMLSTLNLINEMSLQTCVKIKAQRMSHRGAG